MTPCAVCNEPVDEQFAVGVGVPPVYVHPSPCFAAYLKQQRMLNPKALFKLMSGDR